MLVLALKLFLAPACVVAVSLAGRRWGPTVAGLLGGFPVVAGPILLVVTIDQGREFGADAAAGSLLGLTAVAASAVVYARAAPRLSPAPTLLAAWAAFFAGVALLGVVDVSPPVAFLIAAASFELSRLLVRVPAEADAVARADAVVGPAGACPIGPAARPRRDDRGRRARPDAERPAGCLPRAHERVARVHAPHA